MKIFSTIISIILITGAGVMAEQKKLYDFSDPEAVADWVAIHDVVMGGVSSGGMESTEAGSMLFEGVVSLDNNGGFASIRSRSRNWDLGAYDGIEMRLRGDGKRYKFNLRTDSAFDGVMYRVAFATSKGEWQTIRFPFTEFRATFRGRTVPDAPPLDPARIAMVGLLISDKQEGPFRVEIASIGAYSEQDQANSPSGR
jgi:hypothetical protein